MLMIAMLRYSYRLLMSNQIITASSYLAGYAYTGSNRWEFRTLISSLCINTALLVTLSLEVT